MKLDAPADIAIVCNIHTQKKIPNSPHLILLDIFTFLLSMSAIQSTKLLLFKVLSLKMCLKCHYSHC